MSSHRRNLFILLLTGGLLAASLAAIFTKPTKLGLDLQGGVELIYKGKPTKQQPVVTDDALNRAVSIIRSRVDALGVSEPDIVTAPSSKQIIVSLPAVQNSARAVQQVGSTAQLYFYDLEANILSSNCQTHPNQPLAAEVQAPINGMYAAVLRASKCHLKPVPKTATALGPQFYAFSRKPGNLPLNGGLPDSSKKAVLDDLSPQERAANPNPIVIEVPVGVVPVQITNGSPPKTSTVQQLETQLALGKWYVLRDAPFLGGADVKSPMATQNPTTNAWVVTMKFSSAGNKLFASVSKTIAERGAASWPPGTPAANYYQNFGIRLDQNLISTPSIDFQEYPTGINPASGTGGVEISGNFTSQSANDLANLLKLGALPIALELISESDVSATLGSQALHQGLIAGLAGFAIVAAFLLLFYRVLGLIAVVALCVYAAYFFALIKLIPVVLTLPGIAGLILTIGVVADANIVIFERVKEEIREGKSIVSGIAIGYKKGLSAIIDANVVTLLTAFILYVLATADVKAFAFALGVGTLVSLFTAVLVTQAILLSLRGTPLLRRSGEIGAGMGHRHWRLNFIGASRWFFSLSGVILLVGGLAIAGKGLNFGIDFESGTQITIPFVKSPSVNQVRSVLAAQGQGDATIVTIKNPSLGKHVFQISTKTLPPTKVTAVVTALQSKFGAAKQAPNITSVGPSFGASVAHSAVVAIIASLLIIALYITMRFQWKYSIPVLIALIHDLLITAGVYSLTGREVTTSTVAALLTILGYSLYDTIIVFDRIRENVPRMPTAAFSQIVNRSMAEVLTRSLATSFCTLLPVLALFFFGGATLKDFAFALIVGIASGAYSSIFIAGPVLTHWKEREPVYRRREISIRKEHGFVPAFAVATAGAPVDIEPKKKQRPSRSITAPIDPSAGVSAAEFEEMVRDLPIEEKKKPGKPRGGRRARLEGQPPPPPPPEQGGGARPASGEQQGSEQHKSSKKRKHKHGRPR